MLGFSTRRKSAALAALLTFAAFLTPSPGTLAHAQSTDTPEARPAAPPLALDTVLVTARRKLEPLQETPVAVTVLSEVELEDWQVSGMRVVAESSPNVLLQRQGGSAAIIQYNIRGIASGGVTPQLDPGVAMYLDGMYMGRSGSTLVNLWDVEQVEVLRGPQGTLFGRNATGGAVSITTHSPQGSFGGTVKHSLGNYGLSNTQLAVDTPTAAGFSARLALGHSEHQPYVRNTATPHTVDFGADFGSVASSRGFDDERVDSAKIALRYKGSKQWDVDYKLFYLDWRGTQPARQLSSLDPADAAAIKFDQQPSLPGAGTQVLDAKARDAVPAGLDTPGRSRSLAQGLTTRYQLDARHKLQYTLSQSRIDARGGGTGIDGNAFVDPHGSGLPTFLSYGLSHARQSQVAQELQLQGGSGRWDWLLGLFSFRERVLSNFPIMSMGFGQSSFGPQRPITDLDYLVGWESRSDNRSKAIYGSTSLTLDDWVLTAGLRSSLDQRDEDLIRGGLAFDDGGAALKYRNRVGHYSGRKTDLDLSAKLRLTSTTNTYLRYATGYLSGGILLDRPFGREDVRSLEAGVKAELSPRLRVNAALFMMDRRNLQAQVFDAAAGGVYMLNAGTGRSHGLELEGQWLPTSSLRVAASYGFFALRSQNGVRSTQPRQTAFLAGTWTFATMPSGARPSIQLDASWRSTVYRPECPMGALSDPLLGCTQLQNADWVLDRRVRMRAHAVVGLRAGVAEMKLPGEMTGRLNLWIRNLANSREGEYLFTLGNKTSLTTFEPPRTLGLDFTVDF